MKKYLFTLLACLIGFSSYSQNEIEDGKSLIEAYVSPLTNSLGSALNNGWYNTAKPHKLGGFDVTITANIVMVPTNAKTFNISKSNGGAFSGGETPTILGSGNGSPIDYSGDPSLDQKYMPKGINIPVIPLPMLQAGVGLIKGTEIDVRFIPEFKIGSIGKVGLFGIGFKHDLLQWIPVIGDAIPISLSLQTGYTKLSSEIELIDPTASIDPSANLDISATTVNLILSKKLLMFTPYVGLGYNSTRTTFNVYEKYDIAGLTINVAELTKIDFESKNNFRANIGFRFNITVIALQANYTFAEYPTATLGVGVSLR